MENKLLISPRQYKRKHRSYKLTKKNPANKALGKKGEELAVSYLIKKGYVILEQNFQKGYSEIDIIALDGETLVFVEVKTRNSDEFGLPEEAITGWKIKTLIRSAQYYKMLHPELPESMRIDVVAVELDQQEQIIAIRLIKNITG